MLNKKILIKIASLFLFFLLLVLLKIDIQIILVLITILFILIIDLNPGILLIIGIVIIALSAFLVLIRESDIAYIFLDYNFYIIFTTIVLQVKNYYTGKKEDLSVYQFKTPLKKKDGITIYRFIIFPILVLGTSLLFLFLFGPYVQQIISEKFYPRYDDFLEGTISKEEGIKEIDRKNIFIRILNGSGDADTLDDVINKITQEGFQIAGTGNVDSSDYDHTIIRYQRGKEHEAKVIKNLFSYKDEIVLEVMKINNEEVDFFIIVGKDQINNEVEKRVEDKNDINILVQNGSGINGDAARMAFKLEDLGYLDIDTGNASKQNYKDITIIYKEGFSLEAAVLEQDIDEARIDISEGSMPNSIYNILIIVGKR